MTRKVVGRDGVARPVVPAAPDWRPGTRAVARAYRAEAQQREGEAGSFMHAEARIAGQVSTYTPPTLELSGPLPFGPARGGLEPVVIDDIDPGRVGAGARTVKRQVRRRKGPTALSSLPEGLRAVAARYAALVEKVGSPSCTSPDAPRGGGISDGGASSRCALAIRLRRARETIGPAVALEARGVRAHADRGRRSVTVRAVVDGVCIDGGKLELILERHGWSCQHVHRKALIEALQAALERLQHVV